MYTLVVSFVFGMLAMLLIHPFIPTKTVDYMERILKEHQEVNKHK